MRIGVISRDVELATTSRFIAAGERRGHTMVPVRLLDASVIVSEGGPRVLLGGDPLAPLDAFIPRLGAYLPSLALAITRALVASGAEPLNALEPMAIAFDKLRTAETLAAAAIPTPRTILAKDLDHLEHAIDAVGGAPVVIKPLSGAQGRGVMCAESRATAVAILENLIVTGRDHLVQELVPEAAGEDRRLLVLDDEVIAAITRRARPGEFRPNLHRGGVGEAIEPTDDERSIAVRAARAVGLRFAGVDLLRGADGPLVVEVNGSPGLEGVETITGCDLAGAAIALLEQVSGKTHAPSDPNASAEGAPGAA